MSIKKRQKVVDRFNDPSVSSVVVCGVGVGVGIHVCLCECSVSVPPLPHPSLFRVMNLCSC